MSTQHGRSLSLHCESAAQALSERASACAHAQRTEPLAAKFTGPLKAWAALVRGTASELVLVAAQPWQIMVAMSKHSSQFVWCASGHVQGLLCCCINLWSRMLQLSSSHC